MDSKFLKFFLKNWLPAISWTFFILYLGAQPSLQYGFTGLSWEWYLRKMAHGGEYTILSILFAKAFFSTILQQKLKILFILIAGISISILDELIQSFIPARSGRIEDVLIDSIGILIGLGGALKLLNLGN